MGFSSFGAHRVTDEEWAERELDALEHKAYLEKLADAENKDPNFCEVADGGYGNRYEPWCYKHQTDPEHITESGRLVCHAYATTEPGCDRHECCPRNIDGED